MRKRLAINNLPCFVTVVLHERRRLFDDPSVCGLFIRLLRELRARFGFRLFEFVLMPDHYHLIIQTPPDRTLSDTIRSLNGVFAREVNVFQGKSGQVIQHGFHDHVIRNELDYVEKARYIHDNPVRAGLSTTPESYHWSSARARLLEADGPIRLDSV